MFEFELCCLVDLVILIAFGLVIFATLWVFALVLWVFVVDEFLMHLFG